MSSTYELFFGTTNAGGAPVFTTFARGDTHDPLAQPVFLDVGGGIYQFVVDWQTIPSTTIEYVATLNGVELFDVLDAVPVPGLIATTGPSLNLNLYPTAKTVLNRAALQCGLATLEDPFGSTNQAWVLLRDLLTSLIDDLQQEHDWTHLVREATFTTDGVKNEWTLPADFHELVPQTGWNRSTRFPLIGPLSSQQAQMLKARLPGVLLNVAFRIQGGVLSTPIVHPAGALVAFEYVSNYAVVAAGASAPSLVTPGGNTDVLLFDEELLVLGLKLRWLEEKRFDTTATQARYDAKLEHCMNKNDPAPVLSLGGSGARATDRMIDGRNVPEGNWGA